MADTNPPKTNIDDLAKSIAALADAQAVLMEKVSGMADMFKQAETHTSRLNENLAKMKLQASSLADFAGDWRDHVKELLTMSKRLATGGFAAEAKTYKAASAQLQIILQGMKDCGKTMKGNKEGQKVYNSEMARLKSLIEDIDTASKKAGKSMKDVMNPSEAMKFTKALREQTLQLERLVAASKQYKGIFHLGANKLTGGRYEKFLGHAEKAQELKEGARQRAQQGHSEYQANQRGKFYTSKGEKGGNYKIPAYIMPTSKEEYKNMTAHQKSLAKRAATESQKNLDKEVNELNPNGGMLNKFMTKRALSKRNKFLMGETDEMGGGMEKIAAGGGNYLKGAGALAEGGVAEGVEGVLGAAALPMALGAALVKIVDTAMTKNKEVYDQLGGGGGMFRQGQSAGRDFENVKGNLTPSGTLYDFAGANYESNLKIAKAINDSGVSMAELSKNGNGLGTQDSEGKFVGGNSVGRLGNIARVGARLAGFDDAHATEQIMKVLQKYHQSIDSTDSFFTKLNKDTAAAGLTATKYIQIIDTVTESFDHMARSLEDVTGTMRALGHSGILTSEQLGDAMKTLVGGPKTLEQKAYSAVSMLNQPGSIDNLKSSRDKQVEWGKNTLEKALQDAGLDTTGMDLESDKGLSAAQSKLAQIPGDGDKESAVKRQAAGAALAEQQMRLIQQGRANRFANNQTASGAIDYAIAGGGMPDDFTSKATTTYSLMRQLAKMSGSSFGQIMAKPTDFLSGGEGAKFAATVAPTLGLDSDTFSRMVVASRDVASTYAGQAHAGASGISGKEYQHIAGLVGKTGLSEDAAKEAVKSTSLDDLTEAMTKDEDTWQSVLNGNSGLMKTLEDVAKSLDPEAAKHAAQIKEETTTMAEVFAAAFANFFNKISDLLQQLVDLGGGGAASESTIQDIKSEILNGKGGSASTAQDLIKLQAQKVAIDDKIKGMADGEEKNKYKKAAAVLADQIDKTQQAITEFSSDSVKTSKDHANEVLDTLQGTRDMAANGVGVIPTISAADMSANPYAFKHDAVDRITSDVTEAQKAQAQTFIQNFTTTVGQVSLTPPPQQGREQVMGGTQPPVDSANSNFLPSYSPLNAFKK